MCDCGAIDGCFSEIKPFSEIDSSRLTQGRGCIFPLPRGCIFPFLTAARFAPAEPAFATTPFAKNMGALALVSGLLAAAVASTASTAPAAAPAAAPPPRQTAVQRALIDDLEPRAAAASAAATPAVLALLGSDAFKTGLAACCPTIKSKTPAELLALLEAEVAAAELTHNFSPINDSWENDVSIATLSDSGYFFNLWELSYLGLGRKNVAVDDHDGEVNLLGFPPFTQVAKTPVTARVPGMSLTDCLRLH